MQEVNLVKHAWLGAVAGALFLAGCGSDTNTGSTGPTPATGTTTTSSSSSGTTTTSSSSSGSMNATTGKTIAFVTNNASDYWTIARKGTEKAQGELKNYKVQFVIPQDGAAATQKSQMDDLITKGVAGVAISPVDPVNQTPDLDIYASKTLLITQDSDAPDSKRACYLGTDNVAAGKMAGEALMKALPDGGKVAVFVGKSDAANAKERFEGLKAAIAGSKIQIIDLRTDDADHARAKTNVSDEMVKVPDLAACVGLWSYNGPAIYNAVKEANKTGKVQIVCFDQEDDTLAGIKDGAIYATVVQQPYEFGYQAVKLIAKVLDGDKTAIPASKKIIIPTKLIDKSNIDPYWADLKKQTGKS